MLATLNEDLNGTPEDPPNGASSVQNNGAVDNVHNGATFTDQNGEITDEKTKNGAVITLLQMLKIVN